MLSKDSRTDRIRVGGHKDKPTSRAQKLPQPAQCSLRIIEMLEGMNHRNEIVGSRLQLHFPEITLNDPTSGAFSSCCRGNWIPLNTISHVAGSRKRPEQRTAATSDVERSGRSSAMR
jgi:hypothetical protein